MFAEVKSASHYDNECCHFLLLQEIGRTFFRACVKDYAGIGGRRDDVEVNYVVFESNEI